MPDKKTTRFSKQREIILSNVLERKDHPDAEDIYKSVKEKCPTISLGTVYRNLKFLSEEGLIKKISLAREVFDSTISEHYHMVCLGCGKIIDLNINEHVNIEDLIFEQTKFYVTEKNISFKGFCESCKY